VGVKYYDWVTHQAAMQPGKIAIKDLDTQRQFTYKELNERSESLAAWLQDRGVEPGHRVAILARNCAEFFELQFACGKIAAIAVPLNWRLTENELDYIVNDCTPMILLYDVKFREMALYLQEHCQVATLLEIDGANKNSAYEQALAKPNGSHTPVSMSQEDTAMIMYTSGTTGHPKGAEITHQMNLYNCINLGIPGRISPDTVHLVALPLFHTGGLNCYANPVLHAGGQVLLLREFTPGAALKIMGDAELGVTHFFAIPAAYQFMMLHPDFESTDFSGIQVAGVGGAPCAETILKTWLDKGVSVYQGWGMTETSPGGTALTAEEAVRKLGSAGKAVMHTEIKIVDDEGNTVPQGDVGELLIKGPNITPGYWNNAVATAEAFVDGWLKTGDAARFDDEGFIYIVDRSKDMYISGGENVYPAEIENILYQLPQVAEAAVIGIPDQRWGETGLAVLVLKAGESLEDKAVIDHCRKNLAKFKVPRAVEHIDALPRNATGKVLKRVLRDRFVGEGAPAIT